MGAQRSFDASARPLIHPSSAVDKHVIGNGIPRVMNADEEQQRRRRNAKHGLVRMGKGRVRRSGKRCICGEGQQNMKQPVFKLRGVHDLSLHTATHDDLVREPAEAQQSPKNCGAPDPLPGSV